MSSVSCTCYRLDTFPSVEICLLTTMESNAIRYMAAYVAVNLLKKYNKPTRHPEFSTYASWFSVVCSWSLGGSPFSLFIPCRRLSLFFRWSKNDLAFFLFRFRWVLSISLLEKYTLWHTDNWKLLHLSIKCFHPVKKSLNFNVIRTVQDNNENSCTQSWLLQCWYLMDSRLNYAAFNKSNGSIQYSIHCTSVLCTYFWLL